MSALSLRPQRTAVLALAGALVACVPQAALERLTPREHDQLARQFLAAVRAGDAERTRTFLTPADRQLPALLDTLRVVAGVLPGGPVDTLRLVGVNRVDGAGLRRSLLTYELHTPVGWGLAQIGVVEQLGTGARHVEHFRTERIPASLEAINAFRLSGKRPAHYAVLFLALGCAALSLAAAVRAARTPMRRRWLWTFFALVGTSPLSLNWTTGAIGFQLLGVQFLSAGFMRPAPAGPWMIIAAFPLGAVVTLARVSTVRRRKATTDIDASATPGAPSPAG